MLETTASSTDEAQPSARASALYRIIWKWHFLAALYVLPFVLLLSVTGGIYLFKPQIEEFIYYDRLNVTVQGEQQSLETQQAAVLAAAPNARIRSITTSQQAGRSTIFEIQDKSHGRAYAWVNPYNADVLHIQSRDSTLMHQLKKLHGELLLGKSGTKFVELAAQWTLVMFITGLYLWWPRSRSWTQVFQLPQGQGRAWWKQTHLLSGVFASLLIIPLLLSGLPWTDVWGGSLSYIQKQTGQSSPSLRFGGKPPQSTVIDGQAPIPYQQVINTAIAQGLVAPYEMRLPKDKQGSYWIRSASKDRWQQNELLIDQYSGKLLKRINFSDYPIVAKAVSVGISFHQGELYGWANLAQNVLASLLGIVIAVSGFAAWWIRRPSGSLGVPRAPLRSLSHGMVVLIIALSLFLPLMGASILVAITLDWLLFKKLGWFQSHTAPNVTT